MIFGVYVGATLPPAERFDQHKVVVAPPAARASGPGVDGPTVICGVYPAEALDIEERLAVLAPKDCPCRPQSTAADGASVNMQAHRRMALLVTQRASGVAAGYAVAVDCRPATGEPDLTIAYFAFCSCITS
jgi:hypothetical protein